MQSLDAAALVRWRAASSLLTHRGSDPASAVSGLLGLQAQDIAAFPLSVRARCDGCREREVERALDAPPSLVRTWAMRGTLHLVAASDARWLTQLLGPRLRAATAGRRRTLAIPDERCESALPLLEDVLAEGPLVRADIVRGLNDRGFAIAAGSQAVPHLLGYAASVGLVCCGPKETFALVEHWLAPAAAPPDPLAELARRYLTGHGPASATDLAAWSGLPLTRARAALHAIEDELRWWTTDLGPMATLAAGEPDPGASPVARLLPRYDDYLMGWRDRDLVLERANRRAIHPGGGVLNAALIIAGAVRGRWRVVRRRGEQVIVVTPFEGLNHQEAAAVEADVADVAVFSDRSIALDVEQPSR